MTQSIDRDATPPFHFVLSAVLLLGSMSACDEKCKTDNDCPAGKICQDNRCKSADQSEEATDREDASDRDTAEGLLANGASCSQDTECQSNHCGDGFCCAEGECCGTTGRKEDCDNTLCVHRTCTSDFKCHYTEMACAEADTEDGDTCTGTSLCDGYGSCMGVTACSGGPYAGTGRHTCEEGRVEAECYDSCTSREQCNPDFYCADGACEALLENGMDGCAENAHCASGHCYAETGVCCALGVCCNDDTPCGDYRCNTDNWSCHTTCDIGQGDDSALCADEYQCSGGWCRPEVEDTVTCGNDSDCSDGYCHPTLHICAADCSPDDVEDDSICEALGDYHCDDSTCAADIENGRTGCDESSDCVSGSCDTNNGICCDDATGGCCAAADDCNDENPCTEDRCTPEHSCFHLNLEDGTACSDGVFCNGAETCSQGVCQPGDDPCEDTTDACTAVAACVEESQPHCPVSPLADGTPCSDGPLSCLGDAYATCHAGACVGEHTCEETGNPCTVYECNFDSGECEARPLGNRTSCDDGDPCNGADICEAGECIHEGSPCLDRYACASVACTHDDGEAQCHISHPMTDGEPCEPDPCFGEADQTACWEGECVAATDRPCNDANVCSRETCDSAGGDAECGDTAPNPVVAELDCGTTTILQDDEFTSSDYYDYASGCGTLAGREAILHLTPTLENVTIDVTDYISDWELTFSVLQLEDHCAWNSVCTDATGIELNLPTDTGYYFILDYEEALPPPRAVQVQVDCI